MNPKGLLSILNLLGKAKNAERGLMNTVTTPFARKVTDIQIAKLRPNNLMNYSSDPLMPQGLRGAVDVTVDKGIDSHMINLIPDTIEKMNLRQSRYDNTYNRLLNRNINYLRPLTRFGMYQLPATSYTLYDIINNMRGNE